MRRTSLIAALAACLSLGTALAVPSLSAPPAASGLAVADNHVRRAPVSARLRQALGPAGEMRSIDLNDPRAYHRIISIIPDFPRLAADGFTSVTAYIYLYVASPTGSEVMSGPSTPSDTELQLVSTAARQNHLDVHYMPVLLDNATNTFRGGYYPDDRPAFFASYTAVLAHYADLAQSLGVTLFYIGSENDRLAREPAPWRPLIGAIRKHYSGPLSYMCTFHSSGDVKFWTLLDAASISPYFSLGEERVAAYPRLVQAWDQVNLPTVARIAKVVKVPLLFGEIGYESLTGGYAVPGGYRPKGKLPAPMAQYDAYRALFEAVQRSPYVYGMALWSWNAESTIADTGFSPKNKPAECVIIANWSTDATAKQLGSLPYCDLSVVDSVTNATGL